MSTSDDDDTPGVPLSSEDALRAIRKLNDFTPNIDEIEEWKEKHKDSPYTRWCEDVEKRLPDLQKRLLHNVAVYNKLRDAEVQVGINFGAGAWQQSADAADGNIHRAMAEYQRICTLMLYDPKHELLAPFVGDNKAVVAAGGYRYNILEVARNNTVDECVRAFRALWKHPYIDALYTSAKEGNAVSRDVLQAVFAAQLDAHARNYNAVEQFCPEAWRRAKAHLLKAKQTDKGKAKQQ